MQGNEKQVKQAKSTRLKREAVVRMARSWQGPQGAEARSQERKAIDVEAFLAWAWREELPKTQIVACGPGVFGSPMQDVARHGVYGTEIDYQSSNAYGLVPDLNAIAGPHVDAIAAAAFVSGIDRMELALPPDWNPLGDMMDIDAGHAEIFGGRIEGRPVSEAVIRARAQLAATEDGRERLRFSPGKLVVRHALLGGAPTWQACGPGERPRRLLVAHGNGAPRWYRRIAVDVETVDGRKVQQIEEVDGFNFKSRRPWPDSYRKVRLDPDLTDLAVSRAEYEIWHQALYLIAAELGPMLADHALCAPSKPARPWEI